MALNALGLGFTFTARDMATGVMTRINMKIKEVAATSKALDRQHKAAMSNMKKGAATAAAGVGGLMIINKAAKAYGEFEMIIVGAAGKMKDGASMMDALKRAALEAGKATQFSPKEAAEGLSELGAQGLSAKEAIVALNPVLDLAAGSLGQLGVANAAQTAMASLNAFGMAATKSNITDIVNKLAIVSDRSAFQMRDFQVAISTASSQANASKQSFASMLATLGLLRDSGLEASRAATAYREALRRVSGDPRALKMMKKLGVSSTDSAGRMKDISQIVGELKPKLDKLSITKRNLYLKDIMGVRGMATYNAIIMSHNKLVAKGVIQNGQYAEAHQRLVREMTDPKMAGHLKTKVADALNTVGGKYILLKGSWQTFVIAFGGLFAKYVAPTLKKLIDGVNWVIKAIDELPGPTKTLVGGFVAFGSVALVLLGTFKLLRGVWQMFTLARLAGRFVAGQQAAAAATTTTTAALGAQTAAANANAAATTRMGRARAAAGRYAAMGGRALGALGLMYGATQVGKGLGAWVVKSLFDHEIAAHKTMKKWVDFRSVFTKFSIRLKATRNDMSAFNVKLREQTALLIKAATKSSSAAKKVLKETVGTLGKLAQERFKVMGQLYTAINKRDQKGALAARKRLEEIWGKEKAIHEARLHIRAREAAGMLGRARDPKERARLAGLMVQSKVIRLRRQEMAHMSWIKTQEAGIGQLRGKARNEAIKAFEKERLAREGHLDVQKVGLVKFAQRYGLYKKGFASAEDYKALAKKAEGAMPVSLRQMRGLYGITGLRRAIHRKGVGFAGPADIARYAQYRAATGVAAGKITKEEAPRVEALYKRKLASEALEKYTAGKLKLDPAELASLYNMLGKRAQADFSGNITISVNLAGEGADKATVDAKGKARSGKRYKVSTSTTAGTG